MFTGIVEETGTILSFDQETEAYVLKIKAEKVLEGIAHGDSIAVNGCCLSVTQFKIETGEIRFDVLEETKRLTSLANLAQGNLVNLERSLSFNGKVGGHFVTGHIDATGDVEVIEKRGNDFYLRVSIPEEQSKYVVWKGSISLDGISLTVAEANPTSLAVWLIPTTMDITNLKEKKMGDPMNLEFDILGKYVESLTMGKRNAV
ncbi:MAG: riboflavin synthase [Opitutales bacterium]|jgi:riboflavin synthase|nr:riboflavin synthase [Opitutales bacterium]MDB2499363.1 riboflavin synthase [bacterium]MDG2169927.1 riboflavin synthase [Opitutales bacterium]|tara:strand:+ start:113 stop:721 length:609 start_codon:yes stop_codon:yes gene_type:complete